MPPAMDPNKAERVKDELQRVSDLFKDIDENKRNFVQRQIEQLAWLNISIMDLQARIDQFGTLVAYDNGGGQSGVRANPDLKTLNDYQKLATAITRTLNSVVPVKEISKRTGNKLSDFLIDDLDLENV